MREFGDHAEGAFTSGYHLTTKREAVSLALSRWAGEPLGVDEARSLRGSGWDGDLDEMRVSRV